MIDGDGRLSRRDFLRLTGMGVATLACVAAATCADRFLPQNNVAQAAEPGASEAVAVPSEAPNDPEYPNQIADLSRIAEGSEEGYLAARERYSELYALAHPDYISDPNNPNPDPTNAVFILGGGIGYDINDQIDRDGVFLRGVSEHKYSRNWDEGGDHTFTFSASNQESNQVFGPCAVSNNGAGLTGISPVPGMVIPGVTRTRSDTTPLAQTRALGDALSWVAKDPLGITTVVVEGTFTVPSSDLRKTIKKVAEKGVIIVLAPGSTLANDSDIAPHVIIAGSTEDQSTGADVLLSDQMISYSNPADIGQVVGPHIPVAQMTAILQMASGLRPAGRPPIPVSEMKTLIQQYGADPQRNFVHLQPFLEQVAFYYGLIDEPSTPTPTSEPTATSTEEPTVTSTVTPSVTPTNTTTVTPPKPTFTPTPTSSITPPNTATVTPPKPTFTPTPTLTRVWNTFLSHIQK